MPRNPTPSERVNDLRAFSLQGAQGVTRLAAGLEDSCITVRIEAARLLGEVGSAQENVALYAALHRALKSRSAASHRVLGRLATWGLGAAVAVMIVIVGVLSFGTAFKLKHVKPWEIWRDIVQSQRGEEPFILACVEALAAISERAPTPETRRVLDELHALSADNVHLTRETQIAVKCAAERLDVATQQLAELPLPVGKPEAAATGLPLPAKESPDTITLPNSR